VISGTVLSVVCLRIFLCTVWIKKFPLKFTEISSRNGWEFLVQILQTYYTFLSTLEYKMLFNYLQLWRSYAILSATTQFTSCAQNVHHRPKHAGWSHLIWYKFVTIRDNFTKICNLTWIGTCNRRAKFKLKIRNRFGIMLECHSDFIARFIRHSNSHYLLCLLQPPVPAYAGTEGCYRLLVFFIIMSVNIRGDFLTHTVVIILIPISEDRPQFAS